MTLAHLARIVVLWLGLVPAARAAEARIDLDVDRLQEGQRTAFDVVVEGAKPRSLPEVQVEAGLTVAFVGQSQTTSIVNGRMQQYVQFRFEVVARRQGQWRLGPAYVRVDEAAGRTRTLTAPPIQVAVGPGGAAATLPGWLEITTALDRKTAWQGQVVLYHEVLRTRKRLAAAGWYGQPSANLLPLKDARPEHREYVVSDAQGEVLVNETWTPWVVTGVGALAWPAPALEVELFAEGGFGLLRRTKSEVVQGQPLELDVRPLPPPPAGFSGLVGDFQLVSRLERTRARVGESIDWAIALDGDGSVDGFTLTPPKDIEGVRVYDGVARPHADVRQGALRSGLVFARTLVPTREGAFELPKVQLVVFSPTVGDYVTLETPPVTLTVVPGEGVGVEVQSFGGDEVPVDEEAAAAEDARPPRAGGPGLRVPWEAWMPLMLGLAGLPALGLWGHAGVLAGADAVRRRRTPRTARVATPLERLARLPDAPEARLVALDDALRLALARADGVDVAALDRAAVLTRLPADVADEVAAVARALDRARFAGVAPPADLEARLRAVVGALEEGA